MKLGLRAPVVVFLLLSLLTGLVYPLALTGLAQVVFPDQANGSLVYRDGQPVGSALIGQDWGRDPRWFWGRPSATSPVPYTAFHAATGTGSSGSNLAPGNPALVAAVRARLAALQAADLAAGYARPADQPVPVDLVTASGSGLDPHLSLAAIEYQVPRVARARGVGEDQLRALVHRVAQPRQLWVLGEPVVPVLLLNLALP